MPYWVGAVGHGRTNGYSVCMLNISIKNYFPFNAMWTAAGNSANSKSTTEEYWGGRVKPNILKNATHCNWPHPIDPGSLCCHHSARCYGYTRRCHSGTHGYRRALPSSPAAVPHSSGATRQIHLHSPCLRRTPTGPAHTLCCCTGRHLSCMWQWGRRPRRSRLNSHGPRHTQRRRIHTDHWHNGTRQLCIPWPLREGMEKIQGSMCAG